MPTPRKHGGAGLVHFPIVVPGFKGLNTQLSGTLLGPEWVTKLTNSVIDASGRLASRNGWSSLTNTPHDEHFNSGIEYRKQDGTTQFVMTSPTKVLASADGGAWDDVTGTASFISGDWYLVNFNDFVIGFQQDEKALIYNGTTSSQVADGDAPTGAVGTAAFGRVWQSSADGTSLHYSALLNHTSWDPGDVFDLSSVWPDNDTISGVTAFNNLLVVFGHRNILVFSDGTGSELGIDPTQMVVADTIPGIGLYSQFTIQHVDGDIWFLDNSRELRSFGRVMVEQKSGDIAKLSRNVSDRLRDSIDNGNFVPTDIRSGFSSKDRFYLLSLPTRSNPATNEGEVGSVFVFDTRSYLDDGSARCMGIWDQLVPTVIIPQSDGGLVFSYISAQGEIGQYTGGQDGTDAYRMIYETGWIDITKQNYLLILKRIRGRFFFNLDMQIMLKWAWDFSSTFTIKPVLFDVGEGSGLWGEGEWGIAEWGGGVDLQEKGMPGSGTGRYIKIGAEALIAGGSFAIQEMDLLAKVGRLKG